MQVPGDTTSQADSRVGEIMKGLCIAAFCHRSRPRCFAPRRSTSAQEVLRLGDEGRT